MPLSSSFLVVIHTSKIKYRIDCLSAKSGCNLSAVSLLPIRGIPARRRSPWPSLAPLGRVMIRARAQEEGNREPAADGLQRRHISSRNGPHLESNGPLRQQRRTALVWAADPIRLSRIYTVTLRNLYSTPDPQTVVGVASGAPYHPRPSHRERTPARHRWHTTVLCS